MEDILNIIKQTGYWRVLIRPLKYDENLINDKKDCWDIIKKAKVSFRGWDFPHVDRENKTNINNGIQSSTDFYDLKEYWKFFQTGQFIHMSAIREDYMKDKIEEQGGDPIPLIKNENKNYKYLSIENCV